jgi:hypothetical protein
MSEIEKPVVGTASEVPVVTRVAVGEWVVLAAFGAVVAFVYQQILGPLTEQGYASGDAVNDAALFPRIVANVILALCALQFLQLLRKRVLVTMEFMQKPQRGNIWRCILSATILIVYLLALPYLGFYPATFLFVFGLFLTLKARPLWFAAIAALLLTLAVGYIFEDLLRVVLPRGFFELFL